MSSKNSKARVAGTEHQRRLGQKVVRVWLTAFCKALQQFLAFTLSEMMSYWIDFSREVGCSYEYFGRNITAAVLEQTPRGKARSREMD